MLCLSTQCFVCLTFNSTFQLINGISSDLQKFVKYVNSTAVVPFFRIRLDEFGTGWAAVFSNNLALYPKDLKSSVFVISSLKLAASSF